MPQGLTSVSASRDQHPQSQLQHSLRVLANQRLEPRALHRDAPGVSATDVHGAPMRAKLLNSAPGGFARFSDSKNSAHQPWALSRH